MLFRSDVKNLKGWVKDISKDVKSTMLQVAALPCPHCNQRQMED